MTDYYTTVIPIAIGSHLISNMRYFLEVAYKGTKYRGFQIQHNGNTIQGEIEKAFQIFFRPPSPEGEGLGVRLTGSSRTDAGVHAHQNFFHFDWEGVFQPHWLYNLNAILPPDIVLKNIIPVKDDAHCRFDALSRSYRYTLYAQKNPFIADTAYFYPYPLNMEKLNEAAALVKKTTDFTSFSKRNTQVKTFQCHIPESNWREEGNMLIYEVKGNRFLRGMVRALTATMLRVGRGAITIDEFKAIIKAQDPAKAWFDVPGHGLILDQVAYQWEEITG